MKGPLLILSQKRYFSPAWVFASLNILIGTWAYQIPNIKEKIGMTDANLGVVLLFFALGTMFAMPFSPYLIRSLRLGRATLVGIVLLTLCFPLLFVVDSQWALAASLFVVGVASGFTDIAMNTLVVEIEKEDKVSFMAASHGFFSLGGVIGVGLATGLTVFTDSSWVVLAIIIGFVLITNLVLGKYYIPVTGKVQEKGKFRFSNLRPMLPLALIGFVIMGSEGAMVDWSSLYLRDISGTSIDRIGWGYGIFSATMALGRFFGDGISERYGSIRIISVGCMIGIVGYLCILGVYTPIAILGFGLVGLGFSVIIPELYRLAGRVDKVKSSEGISFVAGLGYVGFLLTPPVLGFLAELSSLKLSFIALLVGAVVTAWVTLSGLKKG